MLGFGLTGQEVDKERLKNEYHALGYEENKNDNKKDKRRKGKITSTKKETGDKKNGGDSLYWLKENGRRKD